MRATEGMGRRNSIVEFVDRRPGQRAAPDGEDAYELATEAIEFTVGLVVPSHADADLIPPLGALAPLPTRLERARPWISGGLIALAVGISPELLPAILQRFRV